MTLDSVHNVTQLL